MTIKLITGVMKSGKTEKLIDEIEKTIFSQYKSLIIKPAIDTRDGAFVKTRAHDRKYPALLIDENDTQLTHMLFYAVERYGTVFVDEVQFFSYGFIRKLSDYCYTYCVNLIASGLLKDFKGHYFSSTAFLEENADEVETIEGHCDYCDGTEDNADLLIDTQKKRIITAGSVIKVEGTDNTAEYKVVCKECQKTLF